MFGIKVMGSGAGGGFPQWNCNCQNCSNLRRGAFHGKARTQSSIAITTDRENWVLINASPDIRQQLQVNSEFHPSHDQRGTPIRAVVLVDAQIDHSTGLLLMREGKRLPVYCTSAVQEDLSTGFPVLKLLEHYCQVELHAVPVDGEQTFSIANIPELTFLAVPLVGKAPPYSPHRLHPQQGDNIGLFIFEKQSGRSLFYAPALEQVPSEIIPMINNVDVMMVDGTFWTDDEMVRLGFSQKMAADMGHMPVSGDKGILAFLEQFSKPRKILIHINNTNPILNEDSREYAEVRARGVEVAEDGWFINLE
jgi:pyrroloquinoline quinone biosynthesis protein B